MKRLFDIIMSAILLIASMPLMILFAVLVKFDSGGPVFYKQLRVGIDGRRKPRRSASDRRDTEHMSALRRLWERRNDNVCGRTFHVIKFRTMCVNSEPDGKPMWCREGDPRVTRVGNFLRKSHLDELPQLFNILKGDMSLVGPRPERPEFVVQLSRTIPGYTRRLQVKPGLTGLAQICHRADLELDDVRKKIRYDRLYQQRASVATDLRIVLGTLPMVFGAKRFSRRVGRTLNLATFKNAFARRLVRGSIG